MVSGTDRNSASRAAHRTASSDFSDPSIPATTRATVMASPFVRGAVATHFSTKDHSLGRKVQETLGTTAGAYRP